jgi:hypothetical protein
MTEMTSISDTDTDSLASSFEERGVVVEEEQHESAGSGTSM